MLNPDEKSIQHMNYIVSNIFLWRYFDIIDVFPKTGIVLFFDMHGRPEEVYPHSKFSVSEKNGFKNVRATIGHIFKQKVSMNASFQQNSGSYHAFSTEILRR